MLQKNDLHNYQVEGVNHLNTHPRSMLWAFLGAGKTLMTLTSIVDRMNAGQVQKVLILAPLRVCHSVWAKEASKWEHTKHLTFSVVHGTEKQRKQALYSNADVYLINYEGINWLTELLLKYYIDLKKQLPFQMCVYDEISCLKNSQSVRMKVTSNRVIEDKDGNEKKIKKKGWINIMNHFSYTVGLTGTPSSNGYMDLFGQYLVIDGGVRLMNFVTHFRDAYFRIPFSGFGYEILPHAVSMIESKISDITLSMNNAGDYLDLPTVSYKNVFIDLPPKAMKVYRDIEQEMYTQLDNGTEVEVFNKASLSNKCMQIANGDMYTDLEGNFEHIHTAKLEALEEIMEEAAGRPVLVAYNFKVNAAKMMQKFKKYKPVNMTDEHAKDTPRIVDDWNNGKTKMIICHPKSAGHGIDGLQESGAIVVWMGLNWNLEYYLQMNGRIDRQGQKNVVSIIRIMATDTIDLAVLDAIEFKDDSQNALKNSIQKYRSGKLREDGLISFL